METIAYNIRVAPDIKTRAEQIFSALGLDLGDAINIFLRRSVRERGLPFDIRERIPNAEFQTAIDECDAMVRGDMPLPPIRSVDDIFAELEQDLSAKV